MLANLIQCSKLVVSLLLYFTTIYVIYLFFFLLHYTRALLLTETETPTIRSALDVLFYVILREVWSITLE